MERAPSQQQHNQQAAVQQEALVPVEWARGDNAAALPLPADTISTKPPQTTTQVDGTVTGPEHDTTTKCRHAVSNQRLTTRSPRYIADTSNPGGGPHAFCHENVTFADWLAGLAPRTRSVTQKVTVNVVTALTPVQLWYTHTHDTCHALPHHQPRSHTTGRRQEGPSTPCSSPLLQFVSRIDT